MFVALVRELKIRCYQPKTIKSYRNTIRNLLRWFGGPPYLITREDVRCYLEVLVDGGAGSSWLSTTLSAIHTLFDKFCGQSITLGLVTPTTRAGNGCSGVIRLPRHIR